MNFLIYRWCVVFYFLASLAHSLYMNIGFFDTYMIYWTHLNIIASLITMTLTAVLVTLYHFDKFKVNNSMPVVLRIYWVLWNQTTVFAFLIISTYWALLNKVDLVESNYMLAPILNSVVPLVDLFIVNHPPRFTHFFYVTLTGLGYVGFTVAYQLTGGLNR